MDLAQSLSGNLIRVWGRNAAVGTSVEDLYQYDQAIDWYTVLGAGAKLDVSSSSASDTSAGTGARTIKIVGLDANGNFVTDTITMNGQSVVQSAVTFTDVFGADVTTAGTGLNNAGDIHIVKTGTGGTYTGGVPGTLTSALCKIMTGWSTSVNGHWKVPTGAGTYQITDICASGYSQVSVLQVILREPAATDVSNHVACVFGLGTSGHMQVDMTSSNLIITPGQAVCLRSIAGTSGAVVQATMLLKRVQ